MVTEGKEKERTRYITVPSTPLPGKPPVTFMPNTLASVPTVSPSAEAEARADSPAPAWAGTTPLPRLNEIGHRMFEY